MPVYLFAEIAIIETFEATAMAGFILAHFMDSVMDSVKVELFGQGGQLFLAGAGAMLCIDAHFQILLGAVSKDLSQELGELSRMLCFLPGIAFVSFDLSAL